MTDINRVCVTGGAGFIGSNLVRHLLQDGRDVLVIDNLSVGKRSAVPAGATLWIDSYRTGGGQAGNVTRGQVRVLKTSIPYVSRVENRSPAIGGAEAETLGVDADQLIMEASHG